MLVTGTDSDVVTGSFVMGMAGTNSGVVADKVVRDTGGTMISILDRGRFETDAI